MPTSRGKKRRPAWATRLEAARISTGLNGSAFAKKIGFSQQRYYNWEKGLSAPGVAAWNAIRAELGSESFWFVFTGEHLHETQRPLPLTNEPQRHPAPPPRLVSFNPDIDPPHLTHASFNPDGDLIHRGWEAIP